MKNQDTLLLAKNDFFKYDCSLFAMAREDALLYESFIKLQLPEAILEQWRLELLTILSKNIMETGSAEQFGRMYRIGENMHNSEYLHLMTNTLSCLSPHDSKTGVYLSEMILGRKALNQRSGLAFLAFDLGEQMLANELLDRADKLLSCESTNEELCARIERNKAKSREIRNIMNL